VLPAAVHCCSLDGRRLYITNSLLSPWDKQFYPDMVAKVGTGGLGFGGTGGGGHWLTAGRWLKA
jgi:hypothetical protein